MQYPPAFIRDSFSTLACCSLSSTLLFPIFLVPHNTVLLASVSFFVSSLLPEISFLPSFSSLFIFQEYNEQNRSAFVTEYQNVFRIIQQGRLTEPTLGSSQKAGRLGLENNQEEEKLTAGDRTKLIKNESSKLCCRLSKE